MGARHIAAVIALALLAVTACTSDPNPDVEGGGSGAADPEESTPGGYGGSIAIRQDLDGPDVEAQWPAMARVPEGTEQLVLSVATHALDLEECPPGDPCPDPDDAEVRFTVSALLDFEDVTIEDADTASLHLLGREAEGDFTLDLPPLEAGRHCLLTAVVANATTVTERAHADPSSVTSFILDVGDSDEDHCDPSQQLPDERVRAPSGEVLPSCPVAVLSPSGERMELDRTPGDPEMWAWIPVCADRLTMFMVHDERMTAVEHELHLQAIDTGSWPAGRAAIVATSLSGGSWRLGLFHDAGGDQRGAGLSQPVVLEP